MRFLVLGIGSIGCRHIRNLQSIGHHDITAYDVDRSVLKERCSDLNVDAAHDFESNLDSFDAVLVCTPPSFHVEAALVTARKGKFVFVEKPVSNRLSDAKRLLGYEDQIMVGLNLRYHPLVSYVRDSLPSLGRVFSVQMEFAYNLEKARPNVDYRKGYYAKKGEGGVLLDHIHELDCAHFLFGAFKDVYCSRQTIGDLEIETEDTADLLLTSTQGFSLALHIDYLQERYSRTIKIVAEKGVLTGNYANGQAKLMLNGCADVDSEFPTSFDTTYVDEITDFVAAVEGTKPLAIPISSALHSLALSEAARESGDTGRVVRI